MIMAAAINRFFNMPILIATGKATCIREPRGEYGLEGFSRDIEYKFKKMRDAQGAYYRVYPGDGVEEYYETCGPIIFTRYFDINHLLNKEN
jgi:hypothetical protein